MYTQYCWVDFEQIFECAHTVVARRVRCAARFTPNGAMYIEAVLRNQIWTEFVRQDGRSDGGFGHSIQKL